MTTDYDYVNHPSHYKKFSVETIDMMVAIWGAEAVAKHCEMCAFKYRMRAGEKPDQPVDRDLEKANWYLEKAKSLRANKSPLPSNTPKEGFPFIATSPSGLKIINGIGTSLQLHPKISTNENQD